MSFTFRKLKIQKQILYSLYKKIQKELFEYVCRIQVLVPTVKSSTDDTLRD